MQYVKLRWSRTGLLPLGLMRALGMSAITRVTVEKERAFLQARVAQTSINLKSQQQSDRRLIINFELVKEAGAWKVWRCASAAEDLAGALAKMDDQTERLKLLAQEKELATVELGRALLTQGEGLSSQGLIARAVEMCELALRLAEQLGEESLKVNALRALGRVDELRGNYPQALERYQQSLKIAEEIDDRLGMARVLNGIGNVHDAQGDYTAAARQYQQSLKIAEELDSKEGISMALSNLGNVHAAQGNYAQALVLYRQSLKISEELGNMEGIAHLLTNIGNVHFEQGDYT